MLWVLQGYSGDSWGHCSSGEHIVVPLSENGLSIKTETLGNSRKAKTKELEKNTIHRETQSLNPELINFKHKKKQRASNHRRCFESQPEYQWSECHNWRIAKPHNSWHLTVEGRSGLCNVKGSPIGRTRDLWRGPPQGSSRRLALKGRPSKRLSKVSPQLLKEGVIGLDDFADAKRGLI